jgi:hypothetical protein
MEIKMNARPIVILAACTFFIVSDAQATGLMTCESGNQSSWNSEQTLTDKIKSEGWQVQRIKVDGGCYEVYGTTPEGDRVEAYFHPVTLEKLLVSRRGEILFRKGS